jgi:hypothetical protein
MASMLRKIASSVQLAVLVTWQVAKDVAQEKNKIKDGES